jgi:hypothetical protein
MKLAQLFPKDILDLQTKQPEPEIVAVKLNL